MLRTAEPIGTEGPVVLARQKLEHVEEMIQSSLRHLDWTDSDEIIRRSELYLKDGEPVKPIFYSNRVLLHDLRKIRNHIAHGSKQSM